MRNKKCNYISKFNTMKRNYFFEGKIPVISLLLSIILLTLSCNQPDKETVGKANTENINWSNKVIYEVNIRQFTAEGTFAAFEDHLPRLKELGVDILWLMPIFPIGEKNRKGSLGSYYAVKDYQAVNPEFGTMVELKNIVKKAHEMGMFVILDWVANHSAWDNPLIEEHKDWYTHDSSGQIVSPVPDWSDVADFNYDLPEMREYMMQSLEFWIKEANIDGYRCDVAGMVPTDFWDSTRVRLEQIKPVFMLAEWESSELLKKAFDMDYGWWLMHEMNGIAKGEKDATFIDTVLENQISKYQKDDLKMFFTTNHDENSWNGTVFERYGDGAKTFSVLCFTLNGMPLIYSGQEVGLNKRLRFFEKDTIDWSDNGFSNFYKVLIDLKHNNEALWSGKNAGDFIKIPTSNDNEIYSFVRQSDKDKILVILNLTDKIQNLKIESEYISGDYEEAFTQEIISIENQLIIELKPWDYKVFVK